MTKKTTKQAALEKRTAGLISVTEAARISGLTVSYIRRLLRNGSVEGTKVGHTWLTSEAAVRDYLRQERHPGPKPKK